MRIICPPCETCSSEMIFLLIDFESKIDTILNLDDRMFSIGCPDYLENYELFYKSRNPDVLKHSQIVVENTDNQIRFIVKTVYSRRRVSDT
jgi:hypothetical protein